MEFAESHGHTGERNTLVVLVGNARSWSLAHERHHLGGWIRILLHQSCRACGYGFSKIHRPGISRRLHCFVKARIWWLHAICGTMAPLWTDTRSNS